MIFSDLNTLARQGGFTILQNGGATLLQDVISAKTVMAQTLPIFTPAAAPPPAGDPGPGPSSGSGPTAPPAQSREEVPDYIPITHMDRTADLVLPWYQSPIVALVGVGLVAIFYLQHRAPAKPMAGYRKRRRR